MSTEKTSKRGMHMPGRHVVAAREGHKVGQKLRGSALKNAKEYDTLTAARKAAKSGSCIVRIADGIVVSVR